MTTYEAIVGTQMDAGSALIMGAFKAIAGLANAAVSDLEASEAPDAETDVTAGDQGADPVGANGREENRAGTPPPAG